MTRASVYASICTLLCAVSSTVARAQAPETIRGRVVDDSARVVAGAAVSVTRGPDRLIQATTTDSAGNYSTRFESGTGDYLVFIAAPGYRSARRRVQRDENASGTVTREFIADFTLARDLAMLQAVKVTATRPVCASDAPSPFALGSGNERWAEGVNGQVVPSLAGNLNATAGTIAGVTVTGAGPTILGGDPSSTLQTLNGVAFPGGTLPRAASVETRVTGTSFDATRGGFAGANIDTRLGPGSRDFQSRNTFLTFDAPALQTTDAVGRALGLTNGGFRASVGADGEAIRRTLTYNTALDVSRYVSTPATLLSANGLALARAGVGADTARRAALAATQLGIPVSGAGAPEQRRNESLVWLGRFDDTRDTLRQLNLTTYASLSREGALGFGPLSAPASGGSQHDRALGAQLNHAQWYGENARLLLQNRVAVSHTTQRVDPYLDLPGASVLVRSTSDVSDADVATLQFGGNPWLATNDRRWLVEASTNGIYTANGTRHRVKSQLWTRVDALDARGVPNALGQYTFASLDDFAANRASSFTRTITQPTRAATTWNAAAALSHQWTPSRWFNAIYGARLEAGGVATALPRNTALETALGVRTGDAPSPLVVLPRAGFSYTYSRTRNNGNSSWQTEVGRFFRPQMGYLRGGVGLFRDVLQPTVFADAVAGSGLAGSTLTLACVGSATPVQPWSPAASAPFPTACADGGTALAQRAPSVTLVDRQFDVPRSWRASLNWGQNIGRVLARIDGLASYDLARPSTLDANFSGTSRFTLSSEGDRPVYVSPTGIDAASGAVSSRESRRSDAFGRAAVRTSDLRGYGGQFTFTLAPDLLSFRTRLNIMANAGYTLQLVRQQQRGFDQGTFGDPRVREWAAGAADARHAILLQGGLTVNKVGTLTVFSRLQSGLPFTPLVQSDVNGDGRANDRAFVPAVSDTGTASGMQALLESASPNVRDCLSAQRGRVAARQSCRGPWTQLLNVQFVPRLPITFRGHRLQSRVVFDNPLAGLDQLLNGSEDLRGWGTRAAPDPVLLIPRGFDATARRFRYDVNPRFGDVRASRTLSRQPFRVTMDFSLDLSVPYELQQLRRALEPVKEKSVWTRRGTDSIAAIYLRSTSSVHRATLAFSDTLFLTTSQIARLLTADSVFSAQVRDIYTSLGAYLAARPTGVPGKAELDSVSAAQKRYWPLFWAQADLIDSVVTPQQKEIMSLLKNLVAVTTEERKDSKWFFGNQVPLRHARPPVGEQPAGQSISRGSGG